jgi:hypothetical protein
MFRVRGAEGGRWVELAKSREMIARCPVRGRCGLMLALVEFPLACKLTTGLGEAARLTAEQGSTEFAARSRHDGAIWRKREGKIGDI